MKPDAPLLHDFIQVRAASRPTSPARSSTSWATSMPASQQADVVIERSFTTQPGAPGLHRAARLPRQRGGRRQDHDLVLQPGPLHGARDDRAADRHPAERRSAPSPPRSAAASAARPSSISSRWRWCCRRSRGRPVKMVMTREEVFRATGPTSGSMSTVKIGATKDGTIVAAQGTFYLQAGAFPGSPIRGAAGCAFAPYDIANVQSLGYDVVSNRPKVAAYRAPGAPIGAYAVECVLDELAEALKMDPLELRLKNAAQAGHQGRVRAGLSTHRLRRDARSRDGAPALQGAARARTRAAASPAASGSTPAARSALRSTSPRTAPWWSPPGIPTSAARALRSPT